MCGRIPAESAALQPGRAKLDPVKLLRAFAIVTTLLIGAAAPAAAHTDSDFVAVPAGSKATVTLKPTHGCGTAPTTKVSTRLPVAGATAVEVPGWTATVTPDDDRTVIEWTGGSLPSDQKGAFPVRFTTPEEVGALLLFPFVQECANGEELAWISGDPASDNPSPRLLVLPVGSEPAVTIDDVPADAPGRNQLTAVVDVDNPTATTTTPASTTSSTSPSSETSAGPADAGSVPWLPIGGAVIVIASIAVVAFRRHR